MFLGTNSLMVGLARAPEAAQTATERVGDMKFAEKIRFVLNALISQHGHVTFYVTERRITQRHTATERRQQSVPVTPYRAQASVAFGPETAFESDTGRWILNFVGVNCYPQETDKFKMWIESNFQSLLNDPDVRLNQPADDLKLTRIN